MTLAWCFEDERSPRTDGVLDSLSNRSVHVPVLWPVEVANVLALAERRKRLTTGKSDSFLMFLAGLRIHVDPEGSMRAWNDVLALARAEGVTAYDALYLELATRLKASLASLDRDLCAAAKRRGVAVV